jgi:hypothetical protein
VSAVLDAETDGLESARETRAGSIGFDLPGLLNDQQGAGESCWKSGADTSENEGVFNTGNGVQGLRSCTVDERAE